MNKPPKPSPDFPLSPHARGKWTKKINGKHKYFGTWDDPDGALREYEEFLAGNHKPSRPRSGTFSPLTLYEACQLFLDHKERQRDAGEVSARTYLDYVRTCKRLCQNIGGDRPASQLSPPEFTAFKAWMSKSWNPVSVGNEVTRVKAMLKWLESQRHTQAIETGDDFRKPSRLIARRHKRSRGKKMYDAAQIRAIMDESGIHLRAMVLLGINGGFQNNDCEKLPLTTAQYAIATGWMDFARAKTEVERRFPLWPSTRRALERSLKRRPRTELDLAFIMANGKPLSGTNCDIAKRFRAARDHAYIREGGFSWLRKTFATVASKCGDQVSVDYVMGHVDPSMSEVYRQDMQNERLELVVKTVGRWLYKGDQK